MKILTRYLLKSHLGPFLFAFVALTGVVLINTLARRLADLAGKGLPTSVVLEFFVLAVPATVALTFPMAVLVAVLYTFSQFTSENEITALKASGVDLRRMTFSLLAAALGIAGFMVWFNDRVLPEANHQWSLLWADIARKTPTLVLQAQSINRIPSSDGRNVYMRAGRIDPATNRLWDVSIYDVSKPEEAVTIFADSGRTMFNASRTDLVLRLFNGHIRRVNNNQPAEFQYIGFREQTFGIPGVGNELNLNEGGESYRGDREMTIGMLQARVDTLAKDREHARIESRRLALLELEGMLPKTAEARRAASRAVRTEETGMATVAPDGRSAADRARQTAETLRASDQRVKDLERQMREYDVEIHKKWSIAAASLVFVLVGAPLALRFPAGGIGMVIAASLAIFSLYYVGLIGGEALANRGYLSPTTAMWAMNALMAALGLVGFLRMGRETSTARGGGWTLASLGTALVSLMRRPRRGQGAA